MGEVENKHQTQIMFALNSNFPVDSVTQYLVNTTSRKIEMREQGW